MDSGTRLEQHFHATETFGTDSDDVYVWKLFGPVLVDFRRRLELCVVIHTKNSFSVTYRAISLSAEGVEEYLRSMRFFRNYCGVTASRAKDGVMQSVTFEDGQSVRHAVTRVHARRESRKGQDSFTRHVRGGRVELLKLGLRHALSVILGVLP